MKDNNEKEKEKDRKRKRKERKRERDRERDKDKDKDRQRRREKEEREKEKCDTFMSATIQQSGLSGSFLKMGRAPSLLTILAVSSKFLLLLILFSTRLSSAFCKNE